MPSGDLVVTVIMFGLTGMAYFFGSRRNVVRCGTLGADWSLEPSAWCGVGDVLVPDGGEPLPGSYQFDIGINCQHGH